MLTRIFADNFKALVNFELRPSRLSLLLGENGSGKTSVFDVLGNLRDLMVLGRPVTDLFAYTGTRWDAREVQRFEIDVQSHNGTYRYALEIQHPPESPGKPFIRSELVTLDGALLYRFSAGEVQLSYDDESVGPVFPFRPDQSFLPNLDRSVAKKMARLAGFQDFIFKFWRLQLNPLKTEWGTSNQDNFWLGRLIARFIDAEEKPAGECSLLDLSEGQRVLAALYAAACGLVQPGAMLCFDEPDNFVSLTEIQPWLQFLRDALEAQDAQAIIISHHPEVIDYLAQDSLWWFERPAGPVIARPYEGNDESPLKLSELIARGAA